MAEQAGAHHVRVVAHNRGWADICMAEIESVRAAISPARVFIDHVGSTAVPGLDSKPVIDLLVAMVDWNEAETVASSLAELGYLQKSDHESPPRRFLEKKLLPVGSIEAVHLHLTPRESVWGSNMLVFRDELIADDALAARYAALKRQLAALYPANLESYTAGKSSLIAQVMRTTAGAFGIDRLLTHQRAELNRAQRYLDGSLASQLGVSIVAAISVYADKNANQLNLALIGFLLAALWLSLARRQRKHKNIGNQARRVVLLASGLGAKISAEQRLRIFDQFEVPISGKPLVREESYFASRAEPGYRRLTEMIEESAYWTRALQKSSAAALQYGLVGISLVAGGALWAGLLTVSADAGVSLGRVTVAILVFLLSSDVIGAIFAYRESADTIGELLQSAELVVCRNYRSDDVLLLMSDYNAAVEGAPSALPGIYMLRRSKLTRSWRTYLENKRAE